MNDAPAIAGKITPTDTTNPGRPTFIGRYFRKLEGDDKPLAEPVLRTIAGSDFDDCIDIIRDNEIGAIFGGKKVVDVEMETLAKQPQNPPLIAA